MTTTIRTSVLPSHFRHLLQIVMAARARDLDDLIVEIHTVCTEGRLTDAEAQQLDDAVRARRDLLAERRTRAARDHVLARQPLMNGMRALVQVEQDRERRQSIAANRTKTFGMGRPKPMPSRIKRRLMDRARALMTPTEPGKHYGLIKAKYLKVFEVLLFKFHNVTSGHCFPSYQAIAEAAECARSTVHLALVALEQAGLLSWDHRIKRVFEQVANLFGAVAKGQRSQVHRTSNGYTFFFDAGDDEPVAKSSKSEITSGTTNPLLKKTNSLENPGLLAALAGLGAAVRAKSDRRLAGA